MMDFQSVNEFNAAVNTLCGNFFPLTERGITLGFGRKIYVILTWIVKWMYLITTAIGLVSYIPPLVALQLGGVTALISMEMIILSVYMNFRRAYLRTMIRKLNSLLVESDDLRRCIIDAVESPMLFMKFYTIASVGSVFVWAAMPILGIFAKDEFTYIDFTLPAYLPGAPFTANRFVFGVIVQTVGSSYVIFKKIGIDVYMSYFITLLTAKYRHVREQLAETLNERDDDLVVDALKECVRHHCVVAEIGNMLMGLFSPNIGLTYLNCILRFCFLGFALIKSTPGAYLAKFIIVMYSMGSFIQVYMLCSCVQELLEASTSIADEAFHEDWYARGTTVRSIFRTVGLSNSMECRLSAFRIVDLTVPTFASILNQAYTGCLLLLRI